MEDTVDSIRSYHVQLSAISSSQKTEKDSITKAPQLNSPAYSGNSTGQAPIGMHEKEVCLSQRALSAEADFGGSPEPFGPEAC